MNIAAQRLRRLVSDDLGKLGRIAAELRYHGQDGSASGLPSATYGPTLDFIDLTNDPTFGTSTGKDSPIDAAIVFNGTTAAQCSHFKDPGTTVGNLGTKDAAFEFIILTPSSFAATYVVASKRDTAAGTTGWVIYTHTDSKLYIALDGTSTKTIASNALATSTLYLVQGFVDRDEASTYGGQIYANGAASGSGVDMSGIGDIDSTLSFRLSYQVSGPVGGSNGIALFQLHSAGDWWPGGASNKAIWDQLASSRAAARGFP